MSHFQADSSSKEESETANTENDAENPNTCDSSQTDLQISSIDNEEKEKKTKKHEKKDKKHKEKGKKTVFRHVVRSNTLQFSNYSDFQQSVQDQDNSEKNSNDEASSTISSDSSLIPESSVDSSKPPPSSRPPPPPPKKPPSSSNPPPPPSKKPPLPSSSTKPPPSSKAPPPPPKKPPPSSQAPPPPSKKPPPSSQAPPPPPRKQNSSTNSPPSSANPPPPPPKKPPPSSKPPPPPSSKPPPPPPKAASNTSANTEFENNIPLAKSKRNDNEDDQRLQLLRMGRQKSKTVSGNDIFKHKRYVPLDTPKNTSNIEDVLESSTSNTFLIPSGIDQSKEPLSEQQIIQSYFLKKNEGKNDSEGEIPIDDSNFDKNIKKSRRIRFDRNSSYSNSVFSNIIDSKELQKLSEQSMKEYNDSLNQEKPDTNADSLLKQSNEDDKNSHIQPEETSSYPKLLPASSNPENIEKLAEMNKKAKKILIKRFKKMLENYISEVEINSDFIEIDTSRDSTIHWRKDPHLIKTNELRVESRELENKIASIRFENKDLQNSITDLYQTIGSKNQELMMLQNEISRLKGSSDL